MDDNLDADVLEIAGKKPEDFRTETPFCFGLRNEADPICSLTKKECEYVDSCEQMINEMVKDKRLEGLVFQRFKKRSEAEGYSGQQITKDTERVKVMTAKRRLDVEKEQSEFDDFDDFGEDAEATPKKSAELHTTKHPAETEEADDDFGSFDESEEVDQDSLDVPSEAEAQDDFDTVGEEDPDLPMAKEDKPDFSHEEAESLMLIPEGGGDQPLVAEVPVKRGRGRPKSLNGPAPKKERTPGEPLWVSNKKAAEIASLQAHRAAYAAGGTDDAGVVDASVIRKKFSEAPDNEITSVSVRATLEFDDGEKREATISFTVSGAARGYISPLTVKAKPPEHITWMDWVANFVKHWSKPSFQPIDFIRYCRNHGKEFSKIGAKNVLARYQKEFQPFAVINRENWVYTLKGNDAT